MMNNQFENQAKQFNLAINTFDGALRLIGSSRIQRLLGPYYGEGMEDTVLRSIFSDRYELEDYAVIYHHGQPLNASFEISSITNLYINNFVSVSDRIAQLTERLQRICANSEILTWGWHCYSPDPTIVHDIQQDVVRFAANEDPVMRLTLLYYAGVLLLSLFDESERTMNLVSSLSNCFRDDYHDVARFHRNWAGKEVEQC